MPSRLPKKCAVPYCFARISPRMLMCRDHWRAVPVELQAPVYEAAAEIRTHVRAYVLASYRAILASVEADLRRAKSPTDLMVNAEKWYRGEIELLEAKHNA
jgi:hypothetical protein